MIAPFPTPPPFYHHFTKQNLLRLRQIRREAQQSQSQEQPSTDAQSSSKPDIDILSLPPELRYLLPPPPPPDNTYRSFGNALDLSAPDLTLVDSGIEQLYPDDPSVYTNPTPHLIALTRSLLTTYLALVGILSTNPTLYESKVKDLETIMFNVHGLVNRYRPHQARESLILMMEERVQGLREETRRITEGRARVGEIMGGLGNAERESGRDDEGERLNNQEREKVVDGKWKERQRELWNAMEVEIGSGLQDG
jgi:mediator of RNA polymerase II transcription subunit 7